MPGKQSPATGATIAPAATIMPAEEQEADGGGRGRLIAAAVAAPVAAALGGIGYSAAFIPHDLPLPPAVSGDRHEFDSPAGRLSYYVAGEGAPLLLIHSVNAAASAYEVRPLFEHYRQHRQVYALDLPGFGYSERGARDYTPRLMTDAVHAMVDRIRDEHGPAPIDALALSLGGEFLARAAVERPLSLRTLTLISPTGVDRKGPRYGPPGSTRGRDTLHRLVTVPLWSRALYDLLNARFSARYYLKRTFGDAEIDEGLLDYDYLTSHQPGARHAPLAFISGYLFSDDISRIYEAVAQPVLVMHGVRGDFTDYEDLDRLASRPNWRVHVLVTGALPHFEALDDAVGHLDAFLGAADGQTTPDLAADPAPGDRGER